MVIAILSLAGLFVAFYLMAHSFGWTGPLVCGVGDCSTVQASSWSKIGPVPVSLLGFLGYGGFLAAALVGLQPGAARSPWVSRFLVGAASVALAYSVFLTYLEAYVIHAWCQWCVISAVLVTLIFIAALPEWKRLGGSDT